MPVFETGAFSHSATCPKFERRKLVGNSSQFNAISCRIITYALDIRIENGLGVERARTFEMSSV
jgi:hypothetical protein